MRKLKLDVDALAVQSFRTEELPVLGGTVFGAITEPNQGCTPGAECNTYPQSVCGNCLPTIRECGGSGYGCGEGTDWMTCANTCQTCEQDTCIESCMGTCFTCVDHTCVQVC